MLLQTPLIILCYLATFSITSPGYIPPTGDPALISFTTPFTLRAARPGSPFDHHPVLAANRTFYIPRFPRVAKPNTFCPLPDQSQCPPGDQTAFHFLGTNAEHTYFLYLDITGPFPRIQEVFVYPSGALGFTTDTVDSPLGSEIGGYAQATPTGPEGGPFTWSENVVDDQNVVIPNAWFACPVPRKSLWQVFTNRTIVAFSPGFQDSTVPSGKVKDCLEVKLSSYNYTETTGPAAYEYV